MKTLCTTSAIMAAALLSMTAMANDVFVAENASGAGDGSSCVNAKPVTFFNAAASWGSGGTHIGPGTTVHLCGTIATSLEVAGDGADGTPVTIYFESGAKLSQPACPGATSDACLNTNGHKYLTIDGGADGIIENTDSGTGKQNGSSYGILARHCDGCEIKNLTIQNIYVQKINDTSVDQTTVRCVDFSGKNFKLHDNTMHDAGWCLTNSYADGDHDVRVYNNEIYNIDHGYTLASSAASATGFYFYNNHVHDYVNWDTPTNAYHHDGIHAFGINGARATEFWIYNNVFDGDIGGHVTGHIFLEGGSGPGSTPWTDDTGVVHLFNNVFVGNKLDYGLVQLSLGTNYEVYNNTIISAVPEDGVCMHISSKNAKIKNNFFAGCNQLISLSGTTFVDPSADIDHNVYAHCTSYNCWWWNAIDTSSFTSWQSQCGCDGDSVDATQDVSGGLDASGHPQDGSPVIGAGANLSSLGYGDLNADRDGVPRPASAPWDVGAYAYCRSGCVPPDGGPTGPGSTGSGSTSSASSDASGTSSASGAPTTSGAGGSENGASPDSASDSSGCGCRTAASGDQRTLAAMLALVGVGVAGRIRRRGVVRQREGSHRT